MTISLPSLPSLTLLHLMMHSQGEALHLFLHRLHNWGPTSAYDHLHMPSWLTTRVLSNVSAYETTFIVGGSGCSKSIIAVLLLSLHAPQECTITSMTKTSNTSYSNSPKPMLPESHRLLKHFDMGIQDNIALGQSTSLNSRPVTRDEIIKACEAALMLSLLEICWRHMIPSLGTWVQILVVDRNRDFAITRMKLRDHSVLILS